MQVEREFVDEVRIGDGDEGSVVGKYIRELRKDEGFKKIEMDKRLGVGKEEI